jgi:hypothetical protein
LSVFLVLSTSQAAVASGPDFGVPGPAAKPVPVVLEASQFQGPCDIPNLPPPGNCTFWYNGGSFAIGDANWGFLDLDQWGVDPATDCNAVGPATRGEYIRYNFPTDLVLNDPGPTYVCSSTGHATDNWQDFVDRMNCSPSNPIYANCPGNLLVMPVNDCHEQLSETGSITPCGAGTPDKYAIVGFAALELDGVYRGDDPAAVGTPAVVGPSGSCPTSARLGAAGAGSYGLGGWSLDTIATSQCGAPSSPDTITNVTVTRKTSTGTTTFTGCSAPSAGCDYVYGSATHHLDWYSSSTRTGARKYTVSFDWKINDTPAKPGYCGLHAPDPNAICLVMTWQGRMYPLDVSRRGTGSGTVSSLTGDIRCGSTCSANFLTGAEVTLKANPHVDSTFRGWSGGCSGTGPCTVAMNHARSVTATFSASHLPDAWIGATTAGPWIGKDVFGARQSGQALTKSCAPGDARSFFIRVQNDGQRTDSFVFSGPTERSGYVLTYYRDGKNVTGSVEAGTLATESLAPGDISKAIRLTVKARSSTPAGSTASFAIALSSRTVPGRDDVVQAKLEVT